MLRAAEAQAACLNWDVPPLQTGGIGRNPEVRWYAKVMNYANFLKDSVQYLLQHCLSSFLFFFFLES